LKQLRNARKEIENKFSGIRNNTIAHRERDAMLKFEIMSDLEIMQFSPVLSTFYEASNKLLKAMIIALLEISSMQSIFHQIGYNSRNT